MSNSKPVITPIEKLPRGDYVVHVTASDVCVANDADGWVVLWVVAAAHGRMWRTCLMFRVFHAEPEFQHSERYRLQCIATVAGVKEFEDTDQLHGIPIRMTIWGDGKRGVSFRPYRRDVVAGQAKGGAAPIPAVVSGTIRPQPRLVSQGRG